ncbi:MAG: MarR family transcriptional regulator [Actinomycetota bacterium]|nr:MarR family transcriptional regulator [Actinomycetota bacterium]
MLEERSESAGRDGLRSAAVVGWLRLLRVEQKVSRVLAEDLKRWGLNLAQFDTLAHVGAAEGLTQQELADALLVTKGSICQMLDRMERRGLLARRREGRTNRLFLTGEGRRMFEEVVPAHEDLVGRQLSVLDPEEQAQLVRLLGKLDRAL